jgi:shikimate kinase
LAAELARIVLVGFMAAGKSAVGAELARRLGWRHLDLDAWIEASAGCAVARIFAEQGEAAFRRMETEATRSVAEERRVVVSTGGGWVTDPAHWPQLRGDALFVWLRARPETVLRRAAADAGTRPLLAGAEPERRARELMAAREPLYAAADLTLDTDDRSPAQLAAEILEWVRARNVPA